MANRVVPYRDDIGKNPTIDMPSRFAKVTLTVVAFCFRCTAAVDTDSRAPSTTSDLTAIVGVSPVE
jgi:hypothetical protein